jgi:hypothetical protein
MIRFLDDGRALRGIAVGRHNWTFAGSDRGGERAAAIYTLIETCMCGWPPRCKVFLGSIREKSAACMCPAYERRHAGRGPR